MKESKDIFEKNAIEFVTVAAEFCRLIESPKTDRASFTDTMLKVLPLLYVKALLLPAVERMGDEELEDYVTEDLYQAARNDLALLFAEKDAYMDVFVEDMKYSDRPITRFMSEDLADIYQDIRNFVHVFQSGINQTMHDALAVCRENFKLYWGQKLVNTLRALHESLFNTNDATDDTY